jgi:hypothetical protein
MLLTRRELAILMPAVAAATQTPAGHDAGGSQIFHRISTSTKS